jgi:membrane associated rhomboid family serine protease
MLTYLLIGINVAVSMMAFSAARGGGVPARFLFVPTEVAEGRNLRGMILSNFSHADAGHLLFNMISLYFFAPVVETMLGPQGLLLVYAASGVFAAVAIFLFHRRNPSYRALGASGSVSGVIFASIVLQPGMSIYFFFVPVPIPGPIFAVGYIALSTYLMGRGGGNVSHEAHVGGALAGFVLGGLLYERGFNPLIARILDLFGA